MPHETQSKGSRERAGRVGSAIEAVWEEGREEDVGAGSAVVQRDAREILRQILWHDKRVAYEMT